MNPNSEVIIMLCSHLLSGTDCKPFTPSEWAYTMAHCMLHNVFGHFEGEKMPGYEKKGEDGKVRHIVSCDRDLWNLACDIYVSRFLEDIKFGSPTFKSSVIEKYKGADHDELKIYERLREENPGEVTFTCGTAAVHTGDMLGLDKPVLVRVYGSPEDGSAFRDRVRDLITEP